jgi:predicted transcriptional regulator
VRSKLEATEQQINLKMDCKEADFTDAEIEEQLRESVKDVLSLAKSKVSKYVSLMDPKYGNFMDKAAKMHAKMTRRKCKNETKLTELTPDCARLFTAVNMDPQLCIDLFEAHYLVEKCKDWFHPPTSQDMDQLVKQFMSLHYSEFEIGRMLG